MINFANCIHTNLGLSKYFDYNDTLAILRNISETSVQYKSDEITNFLFGDYKRMEMYGKIKQFYPEELIYLKQNIDNLSSITKDDLLNIGENVISKSVNIGTNLRLFILVPDATFNNVTGFDIYKFYKNDRQIISIFIEDKELTTAEFFMLISNYVSAKYDYGLYQTGLQLDTISLDTININIKLFAIRYLIFIINDIIKICKMNNKDIEWLKNYICSVSKISKDICEKIIKYVNKYGNEQSIEDEYELLELL